MYLLPLYTFFFFPPRRPERPIEEGRIQSVYSKRRNYRTFQATRKWRKCNWNNQERKKIRLPRQLFGLELGSSTLVVLFYFGQ